MRGEGCAIDTERDHRQRRPFDARRAKPAREVAALHLHLPPHRALPAGARRAGALEGGRHDFTGQVVLSDGFRDAAQLEALRRWAFRRFYLRPSYAGGLLHRKLRDPDAAHQLARLVRGSLLAARMSLPGMAP